MTGKQAAVAKFDKTDSSEKLPIGAMLWIMGAYLLYAWDRLVVPFLLPELQKLFELSASSAGLLASIFTFGLALTAIPAGAIVLRIGTRNALVLGAVIFSVFTAYVPIAFGALDLGVSRVMSGVGEGLYNVALFSFLGALSARHRGMANGCAASVFGVGAVTAPLIVAGITNYTGDWRIAFYCLALLGLVGAVGIGFSLKSMPSTRNTSAVTGNPVALKRLSSLLDTRNLAVCLLMAVCGIAVYGFISTYPHFLRTNQKMDLSTTSFVLSVGAIGAILGGAPFGMIADRVGRKRFLIVMVLIVAVTSTIIYSMPPQPLVAIAVCFVLEIALNAVYANAYALIQDQVAPSDIPLATGVLAAIYFLTAAFSGWLVITAQTCFGYLLGSFLVFGAPLAVMAAVLAFSIRAERRSP